MPDIFQSSSQNKTQPAPATDTPTQPEVQVTASPTPQATPTNASAATPFSLPSTGMNLFSTLSFNPDGIHFVNQEPNEDVILFFRADFITNVPWIVTTIILLFVPVIFAILAPMVGLSTVMLTPQANLVILFFYYLLLFGYAFISFMYWFYNVGIVSKKNIISIDFADVTYKNVATTPLSEVSDIDYTQQGFFQTFFDFGNVLIRTEGASQNINFYRIPQPDQVTNVILQLRQLVHND